MRLDRFRDPAEAPPFPFAAMIDVLFLMIIFLVLGANFDSVQSVTLPSGKGAPEREAPARVELLADGGLLLGGAALSAEEVIERLKRQPSSSVLLLPDRNVSVGRLFALYGRLEAELAVPVRVGVLPPSP